MIWDLRMLCRIDMTSAWHHHSRSIDRVPLLHGAVCMPLSDNPALLHCSTRMAPL